MSCVNDNPTPPSFTCLLEIVNDVRSGAPVMLTVRKVLCQLDGALAQFGDDTVTLLSAELVNKSLDVTDVCDEIENICKNPNLDPAVSAMNPVIAELLKILLQLLLTRL